MRVRLVALLGSLALLAILGAPTLAMSLKAHVPTAPWQWSRGTEGSAAGAPGAGAPVAAGERTYLAAMVTLHQRSLAAARQLERSPQVRLRNLAAAVVEQRSAELGSMQECLTRWYPQEAEAVADRLDSQDQPALSRGSVERALLRTVIGDRVDAVTMSRRLLANHLAVHPAVARLALRIQQGGHAQLQRLQHWLAVDLGGPVPQGTGPRMMGH
jgi:uncharacterized protein (DUF305 family)